MSQIEKPQEPLVQVSKKINEKKQAAEILKGVQQSWAKVMHKVRRMNNRVLFHDKA